MIGHTLAQMYPDTDVVLRAARARDALLDAPGLIHWIRELTVPGGGASDGQPKAKYRQAPVPVREEAVDDADELWVFLREWVLYWHERTASILPPAALRSWTVLPASTTPEEAETLTADLVQWLIAMDPQIQLRPDNPDYPGSAMRAAVGYWDDVRRHLQRLNDRYPRRARRERPAEAEQCPLCSAVSVVAHWDDEGSPWDVTVRCAECWWTPKARTVTEVVQWMKWADTDVEQLTPSSVRVPPPDGMVRRFTVQQAAERVKVARRTITRWIDQGMPFVLHPADSRTKLIREDVLTERLRRSLETGGEL